LFRKTFLAALSIDSRQLRSYSVAPAADSTVVTVLLASKDAKASLILTVESGVSFVVGATTYTALLKRPVPAQTQLPATLSPWESQPTTTSAPPPPPVAAGVDGTSNKPTSKDQYSTAQTIGLVVGCCVGLLAVLAVLALIVVRRSREQSRRATFRERHAAAAASQLRGQQAPGTYEWEDSVGVPVERPSHTDRQMEWEGDQPFQDGSRDRVSMEELMSNNQLDQEINRQLKILRASYALEGSNPGAAAEMLTFLETIQVQYNDTPVINSIPSSVTADITPGDNVVRLLDQPAVEMGHRVRTPPPTYPIDAPAAVPAATVQKDGSSLHMQLQMQQDLQPQPCQRQQHEQQQQQQQQHGVLMLQGTISGNMVERESLV